MPTIARVRRWTARVEGVIDLVEARAPHGFDNLDAVASFEEREAIVRGYASMAGYGREQVNRRDAQALTT